TRVLILTKFYDSVEAARAMAVGASGFLLKRDPIEMIIRKIERAAMEHEPVIPIESVSGQPTVGPAAATRPVLARPTPPMPLLPRFVRYLREFHARKKLATGGS